MGLSQLGVREAKYAATLDACGPGPFASALELGASIGVFTGRLAPRCRRLITLDAAPTAVTAARAHLAGVDGAGHTDVRLGTIPADLPDGPFDLVVASEILYYLDADELQATLDRLAELLAPGARLVAVHWRPDGAERPLTAAAVHAALRALPWLPSPSPGTRTPSSSTPSPARESPDRHELLVVGGGPAAMAALRAFREPG